MEGYNDEREFSDEQNRYLNDQSVRGELGFEDRPQMSAAHSKRSRHMWYEYNHQWDE